MYALLSTQLVPFPLLVHKKDAFDMQHRFQFNQTRGTCKKGTYKSKGEHNQQRRIEVQYIDKCKLKLIHVLQPGRTQFDHHKNKSKQRIHTRATYKLLSF